MYSLLTSLGCAAGWMCSVLIGVEYVVCWLVFQAGCVVCWLAFQAGCVGWCFRLGV